MPGRAESPFQRRSSRKDKNVGSKEKPRREVNRGGAKVAEAMWGQSVLPSSDSTFQVHKSS